MKKTFLTVIAAGLMTTLVACDNKPSDSSKNTSSTTPKPADNTANNKKDKDGTTKTPMDQSNSPSDIRITADIRKAILEDKSMSTNEANIKIITESGVVTLRGVVSGQTEKDSIETKAKAISGVVRVDNQLEIAPPKK